MTCPALTTTKNPKNTETAPARIHRKHLQTSSDLPIMVSIIDEESKIQRFLPSVEAVVKQGIVAHEWCALQRRAVTGLERALEIATTDG